MLMPFKTLDGKLFYRIGDIIISTNSENPTNWYGGTWQLFAPGRTLVCLDTSQGEFNSIKKTGGAKTHTLTVAQMPSHNHSGSIKSSGSHYHDTLHAGYQYGAFKWQPSGSGNWGFDLPTNYAGEHTHSLSINNNGGNGSHNNLQPFIVVYMWIRTA